MLRIQADVGSITPGLVTNLVRNFRSEVHPDIIRLQQYAEGLNPYIKESDNYDSDDKRVSIPSGKNLVENTTNYLFSKRADYNCEDYEYKTQITGVQKANKDHDVTKLIGWDLLANGEAYKLVYDSGTGNSTEVSYARIDPSSGFMVYDYNINPKKQFFVRFYTTQIVSDTAGETAVQYQLYVEVYTESEVIKLKGSKSSSSVNMLFRSLYSTAEGSVELQEYTRSDHIFGQVPVVHYMGEHYTGLIYTVIDLIDAIDITATQVAIEVVAYQLCMMINKGAKFKASDIVKIKEGRVKILNIDKEGALEYLTKDVDYQSVINVLNWYIDTLHDVSGVPNFNKKDFSAATGIALAYKLIGYDNISKTVSGIFSAGESDAIALYNALLFFGESVRKKRQYRHKQFLADYPERAVTVKINTNIPLDKQSAVNMATSLKTLGMDMETILKTLPDEIVDDVEETLKRIDEQQKKNIEKQQELFKQQAQGQQATVKDNTEVQ